MESPCHCAGLPCAASESGRGKTCAGPYEEAFHWRALEMVSLDEGTLNHLILIRWVMLVFLLMSLEVH